jgi:DNA processing protein
MEQEELYWYWLCNVEGVGVSTITKLLSAFGTPQDIYHAGDTALEPYLTAKQLEGYRFSRDMDRIKRELERLRSKQIRFCWRDHPMYPSRLKTLYDAPYGVYLKGILPPPEQRSIAIVGARKSDYYGNEMAVYFARELAKRGMAVISGLAYGVDGYAHRGALEAGGATVGILGCGINICYPKENYKIFQQMEQRGGILSEYGLDVAPRAGFFPLRNRLIAAMSDGILVTQARVKSGSLITVDQGLEQGKDIFAIPGRIGDVLSEGCNRLIRDGAVMVTKVEDILTEWGQPESGECEFLMHRDNGLVKMEKMVYSVLGLEPKYIDTIMGETQLSIAELMPVLMRLERAGYIKQGLNHHYSIVL